MATLCLKFQFEPNEKVNHLLSACFAMVQQAVDWAIANKKTATHTIVKELYPSFREQFPELHSTWAQKAARTAASMVHSFNNRKRKGKERRERPELKNPHVYVAKSCFRWEWDGTYLTIRISVRPRDPEPIVFRFRPHHKYRRFVEDWEGGRCDFSKPTLTPNSLSIPLKYPDLPV